MFGDAWNAEHRASSSRERERRTSSSTTGAARRPSAPPSGFTRVSLDTKRKTSKDKDRKDGSGGGKKKTHDTYTKDEDLEALKRCVHGCNLL